LELYGHVHAPITGGACELMPLLGGGADASTPQHTPLAVSHVSQASPLSLLPPQRGWDTRDARDT
jgi:hypothetical protein